MTEIPTSAAGVKPLDLSNLLRHAFMFGFETMGGTAEAAKDWWPEYNPEECSAFERIRSVLIPPSRAADLIVALRALLLPADEIDRQAGQMDPLTQAPVKISHDAIIDLRNAIDKADSLLAEIEEKTVDQ